MSGLKEVDLNQDDFVFSGPVTQEELIVTYRKRRQERMERERAAAKVEERPIADTEALHGIIRYSMEAPLDESPKPDHGETDWSRVPEPHSPVFPSKARVSETIQNQTLETFNLPSQELVVDSVQILQPPVISPPEDLPTEAVEIQEPEGLISPSEELVDTQATNTLISQFQEHVVDSDQVPDLAVTSPPQVVAAQSDQIQEPELSLPNELAIESADIPKVDASSQGQLPESSLPELQSASPPSNKNVAGPPVKPSTNVLRPARLNVDSTSFTTDWTRKINMKKVNKPKRPQYARPLE